DSLLTAGIYTVTITDKNNCTTTATTIILNDNDPTATTQSVNTCQGKIDGAISIQATGIGDIFLWSNGISTQNLNSLATGSFSVTVTDVNGCTSTTSATIIQYPDPTLSMSDDSTIGIGHYVH